MSDTRERARKFVESGRGRVPESPTPRSTPGIPGRAVLLGSAIHDPEVLGGASGRPAGGYRVGMGRGPRVAPGAS